MAVSNLKFTGAVIGSPSFNYFGLASIGIFAVGLFLLYSGRGRFISEAEGLEDIMEEIDTRGFGSIVIDSSAVMTAKNDGQNVANALSKFKGKIYVPKSIYGELKQDRVLGKIFTHPDYKGRVIISDLEKSNPEVYRNCKKEAVKYLKDTKKREAFVDLTSYYRQPDDMTDEEWAQNRVELERDYAKDIERVSEQAEKKIRKKTGTFRNPTNEEQYAALRNSYGVSKEDIDVLSTAFFLGTYPAGKFAPNKYSVILSNDGYITEAVKDFQRKVPKRKENVECYSVWERKAS